MGKRSILMPAEQFKYHASILGDSESLHHHQSEELVVIGKCRRLLF